MTAKLRLFSILALLSGCASSAPVSMDTATADGTATDTTTSPGAETSTEESGLGSGSQETDSIAATITDEAESVSMSASDTALAPAAPFVGTWGTLLSTAVKQTAIPVIQTQIEATYTFYLTQVTSDGNGTLTLTEQACGICMVPEAQFQRFTVPQAFIDGLEPVVRHVNLTSDEPGTPFVSDDVYEVRGAKLQDPIHDPLPPPCSGGQPIACDVAPSGSQCDQDSDNHPGMTLRAPEADLYVVERWLATYSGEVIDQNNIAGSVSKHFAQQSVIGTSLGVCSEINGGTAPLLDKCPEHFYFKMVRMPAGSTCDDVLALSTCDEKPYACNGDDTSPLNPKQDDPADCK